MFPDVYKAIREINDDNIKKEIEKARRDLECIDADSIRTIIKLCTKKIDRNEINHALEKAKIKLESINIDSIINEVKKSIDHFEIEIYKTLDSIPKKETGLIQPELIEKTYKLDLIVDE